jgi:hypothetical protein
MKTWKERWEERWWCLQAELTLRGIIVLLCAADAVGYIVQRRWRR